MAKRKWIIGTSAVLLVLMVAAGFAAIAADVSGQEDPVVSLSYLTDVLAPDTIAKVEEVIALKTTEMETSMNQKLAEYTSQLDTLIADFETRNENIASDTAFIDAVTTSVLARIASTGTDAGSINIGSLSASGWSLVQVTNGATYTFEVGGMIHLRIGSAACFTPSSPGLIDCTEATELTSGNSLSQNHLYLVTVAGRGFTATSDSKIMVYGSYTVS